VLVLSQYFHGGLKFDDVGRHVHAGSFFLFFICDANLILLVLPFGGTRGRKRRT